VNDIEDPRLFPIHAQALLGDDAQARLFDARDDPPRDVALGRIRFDDGKRAFYGHDTPCHSG